MIVRIIIIIGPRQANLVLIAYASSEGSGEPAHPCSLARTFAPRLYKQWIKRNLQTESQIPGPSEWLGMRSWNLSWRNARRHKFAWRGSIVNLKVIISSRWVVDIDEDHTQLFLQFCHDFGIHSEYTKFESFRNFAIWQNELLTRADWSLSAQRSPLCVLIAWMQPLLSFNLKQLLLQRCI